MNDYTVLSNGSGGGWNYRVIVKHSDHPINKGERYFQIHECYYDKRGDTLPSSWSNNAIAPMGHDEIDDLKADLNRMLLAFNKPVLIECDDKLIEWKP